MERTNLIKARKEKGMRQQDFADAVGVHRTTVIAWEDGTKEPHPDLYPKIRRVLDNQDSNLFDICQKTSQSHQLSTPCQVTTNRAILESTDLTIHIPRSVGGFREFMELVRRQFIEALAQFGLTASFGGLCLGLVSSPSVDPEEYLALVGASIGTWWEWFNQGKLSKVDEMLGANVPILKRLANTFSPFQGVAAGLAAQAKFMQMLLETRRYNFVAREIVCAEAVHFGRLSGSNAILALALDWQGNTYTICCHQPQNAIPILHDALSYLDDPLSSTRSGIYSNLSIAYAQEGDEGESRKYAELAHMVMPEYPELDPFHRCVRWNHSALNDLIGVAHLALAGHFPDSDYAQLAYNAFDEAVNRETISKSTLGGTLTRRADAACALGDMKGCVEDLTEGLCIAVKFDSLNHITKAANVISRVPPEWKQETSVQKLQKEITHAIAEHR